MKAERQRAGLTQEELAELADVSVEIISNWERATRKPTLEFAKKVADALGIAVDKLI